MNKGPEDIGGSFTKFLKKRVHCFQRGRFKCVIEKPSKALMFGLSFYNIRLSD